MTQNKKIILIVLIVLILIVGGYFAYNYFLVKKPEIEKEIPKEELQVITEQDILKSLSAPEGIVERPLTEEDKKILESLSAPKKPSVPKLSPEEEQRILESLSAPTK